MGLALALDDVSVDVRDAERLREQAATLAVRAERLREDYLGTLRESRALERQAVQIEEAAQAAPPAPTPAQEKREHDAELMGRVCDTLASAGALSSSAVAEHVGISQARARTVLTRLEAIGMVVRSGLKRATVYRLTTEQEIPTPEHHGHASYERVIRDAVVRLDTFDMPALAAELPDITEHTLRRWVGRLESRGLLESERDGQRKVYAYVAPEGPTRARTRHARPEDEARRMAGPAPRRGDAVAGASRKRIGSPVVDALVREASKFGVTVTTSKHRVEYRKDGRIIATSSKTPGASGLAGTRKQLRDAGVPVA